MAWFVAVGVILIALYNLVCWGAATYDLQTGEKYSGWRRIARFIGFGGGF